MRARAPFIIHPGSARTSSSVNSRNGAVVARIPALRAAERPCVASNR
jgi:hypothetical protein